MRAVCSPISSTLTNQSESCFKQWLLQSFCVGARPISNNRNMNNGFSCIDNIDSLQKSSVAVNLNRYFVVACKWIQFDDSYFFVCACLVWKKNERKEQFLEYKSVGKKSNRKIFDIHWILFLLLLLLWGIEEWILVGGWILNWFESGF